MIEQEILEAAARLVAADLSDGTSGNISVREGAGAVITPSGRRYAALRPRDLVRVDFATGRASGRWPPSSEWRMHLAIYGARPDVDAVVHHHGTWSAAAAVARTTIPILIDEAADVGVVRTAPYAPSGSAELAAVAAQALTDGQNAVLLANHGAVALGGCLEDALRRALHVERLAKILIGARLLGGAWELTEAELAHVRPFFSGYRAEQRAALAAPAASEAGG